MSKELMGSLWGGDELIPISDVITDVCKWTSNIHYMNNLGLVNKDNELVALSVIPLSSIGIHSKYYTQAQ